VNILVIRRDNIGDLVCTTPLIAALRLRYPRAHIAALVNSYNAAVLEGNPDLDAVHSYTKLKHREAGESAIGLVWARLKMLAQLRAGTFDYVVLAKAAFDRHGLATARQLRRRQVVGFSDGSAKATRAITLPMPARPYAELHEVQVLELLGKAMGLERADGPLRVYPSTTLKEQWRKRVPPDGIAVHISARERERRWPAARWADLVRQLPNPVLLWSPGPADHPAHPGDDDRAAEVLKLSPNAVPAPTQSLSELIAVLSLCHSFIGVDGGAMHLAAALGLPTLALFENLESKKKRWYPWKVRYEMVAPATHEVADIAVDQVIAAWARLRSRIGSGKD